MVKFILPANSKVVEGRAYHNKEQNISPKKLKFIDGIQKNKKIHVWILMKLIKKNVVLWF